MFQSTNTAGLTIISIQNLLALKINLSLLGKSFAQNSSRKKISLKIVIILLAVCLHV